jgi:hypothetical protein
MMTNDFAASLSSASAGLRPKLMDLNPLIPSVEGEAYQSMPVGEAEWATRKGLKRCSSLAFERRISERLVSSGGFRG